MFSKMGDKVYVFSADGRPPSMDTFDARVTFDTSVAERGDARLFSYTSPEMQHILRLTPKPAGLENKRNPRIIRVHAKSGGRECVGYFYRRPDQGLREVATFSELRDVVDAGLDGLPPLSESDLAEARNQVERRLENELANEAQKLRERHSIGVENARLRCRSILDKILAVTIRLEFARSGHTEEAESGKPSRAQVSRKLEELVRDRRYYVPALLSVAGVDPVSYSLPEYVFSAYGEKRGEDELNGELGSLTQAAKRVIETYKELSEKREPEEGEREVEAEVEVLI